MGATSGILVSTAKLTGTILKETLAHPLKTSTIEMHWKHHGWEITVRTNARKPQRKAATEKAE
jgi:hypothetical protein